MSVLLRKALADVTRRKGRTILMILGILIGVLGLTAVNEATGLIGGAFFYTTDPEAVPNLTFIVDRLPAAVVTMLHHLPNVARVELRTIYLTRWYPAGNAEPHTIEINGYDDFQQLPLGGFQLTSGRLPGRGEIVLDESDQALQPGQPIAPDDMVMVDTPDGQHVFLRVVGLAQTRGLALWHIPPAPIGYMSAAAMQQLIQQTRGPILDDLPRGTQILIQTQDPSASEQTYETIAQVLRSAHLTIMPFSEVINTSFDADTQFGITGLLTVIRLLAGLALLLACVLIFNAVTTLLSEQLKVIGTMKALGGTRPDIAGSYLLTVGIYSMIGTALGLELGLVLGYQLAVRLASLVQIQVANLSVPVDVGPFQAAPWVLVTSVLVGLLAPLLSALWPLWTGTRITVREALSAYGVRAGTDMQAQAWGRTLRWMPQTAWLGLRGLFRKRERAITTLLVLTLSSTVFLAVQLTDSSLQASIDQQGLDYHSDFRVDLASSLGETVPSQRVLTALQSLPNVERIEPIDPTPISIAHRVLELNGLPAGTRLYQPQVIAGRWLQVQDRGTLVINDSAAARLHLQVGEQVTVHLDTQQANWTIVGIVHDVNGVSGSANPQGELGEAFTTLDNLNRLRHAPTDAAERLWLQARDHSPQALQVLQGQIEHTLQALGLSAGYVLALQQDLEGVSAVQLIISLLFDAAAVLVALMGLLGLSQMLTASVLERRLEIGILRSLGATSWHVGGVFCIEGVALAAIAWGLGTVLGLLTGAAILNLLGTFMRPIDLAFRPLVLLTMLCFVMGVACLASFGPALSAARVQAILRYE